MYIVKGKTLNNKKEDTTMYNITVYCMRGSDLFNSLMDWIAFGEKKGTVKWHINGNRETGVAKFEFNMDNTEDYLVVKGYQRECAA